MAIPCAGLFLYVATFYIANHPTLHLLLGLGSHDSPFEVKDAHTSLCHNSFGNTVGRQEEKVQWWGRSRGTGEIIIVRASQNATYLRLLDGGGIPRRFL
jgi:hypothetical protein